LVGTGFGRVFLVDMGTRAISELPTAKLSEILNVRFVNDTDIMAVDDMGHLASWRRTAGTVRPAEIVDTTDYLTAAAIRSAGDVIALGDGRGVVHIYKTKPLERLDSFHAHTGEVASLSWVPGSERLLSAGADGNVATWNLEQIAPMATPLGKLPPSIIALRYRTDGDLLIGRASVGSAEI
jgi:WD40 repeat protein